MFPSRQAEFALCLRGVGSFSHSMAVVTSNDCPDSSFRLSSIITNECVCMIQLLYSAAVPTIGTDEYEEIDSLQLQGRVSNLC